MAVTSVADQDGYTGGRPRLYKLPTSGEGETTMEIDCDSCQARGLACDDCVVTVLLGHPDHGAELDHAERTAIGVLSDAGLVPPLRLIAPSAADTDAA